MGIIAEGVETEDELRQLQLLQCGNIQGFLFSKPVPSEIVDETFIVELNNRAREIKPT